MKGWKNKRIIRKDERMKEWKDEEIKRMKEQKNK